MGGTGRSGRETGSRWFSGFLRSGAFTPIPADFEPVSGVEPHFSARREVLRSRRTAGTSGSGANVRADSRSWRQGFLRRRDRAAAGRRYASTWRFNRARRFEKLQGHRAAAALRHVPRLLDYYGAAAEFRRSWSLADAGRSGRLRL